MKYSPKNIKVACDHKGLTHFGGVYFLSRISSSGAAAAFPCLPSYLPAAEQPLSFVADDLRPDVSDRTGARPHRNRIIPTFQRHLPVSDRAAQLSDPQTLRRFLFHAPERFWEQLHRINDRLLQSFIHLPDHRSRLIFDLDSTVLTVFGHQDGAEVASFRGIAENALITHCCAWKPTLPTSGTPSSVAATLEPGTAPPSCSPPALPMSLPISAKCAYEPMQVLGSIPSSTPSNLTPPSMPLSLV